MDGPAPALARRGLSLVERQVRQFLGTVVTTLLQRLGGVTEAQLEQGLIVIQVRVGRSRGEPPDQDRDGPEHRHLAGEAQRQGQLLQPRPPGHAGARRSR